ncbi:MAG: glycosyltransferase [Geodermatophilaceae bacterium]|nr:glycosyltransferase [Geodermatophilaceae bacterium]
MSSTSEPKVVVVVSGWPRVSEVFALNELTALHEAGMLAAVLALKEGESGPQHPAAARIGRLVEFVPAGDLRPQADFVGKRAADTGAAAIHGYFAHQPAAVAAAAARRTGLPFGFSVHALDVRRVSRSDLADRVRRAALVVSCNGDAAAEVAAAGGRATLVRHGVDLAGFPASDRPETQPVSLLAVGRFVEKKGFEVLLRALARVERPFRLTLVGDGVLRERLIALADDLGLADRIRFAGRLTHETLPAAYAAADLVVVPSIVDSRGDRDGLPNVVLEAMASRRPVVATDVSAIPSAVRDGVTGVLVSPGDITALAAALTGLIDAPAQRRALGAAGRSRVEAEFGLHRCTRHFLATLRRAYG